MKQYYIAHLAINRHSEEQRVHHVLEAARRFISVNICQMSSETTPLAYKKMMQHAWMNN